MSEFLSPSVEKTHKKYLSAHSTIVSWIPPSTLLCIGVVIGIPFALTESLLIRSVQVLVCMICALQIKHVKIWYFVMITTTIILFSVLVPNGRVLFEIGSFPITEGALKTGAFRGLTLNGYVFLSLCFVSNTLVLPTKYGKILSRTLTFFNIILQSATDIRYKNFITQQKKDSNHHVFRKNTLAIRTDALLKEVLNRIGTHSHKSEVTRVSATKKCYAIIIIGIMLGLSIWGMLQGW